MCCSSFHVPCFRPIGWSSSVRLVDFSSISSCFDASYRNIPINIGAQNYNPLRYSEFSVLLTPASVQTSSITASTSTAKLKGRRYTPIAERACLPTSPNTSSIRSEQPDRKSVVEGKRGAVRVKQ